MRIVGGRFKGQKIASPPGDETRPTADAQREAIFNVLLNGMGHEPRRVLDLFAGTGGLGLEALSQGAEVAVFVEKSPAALKSIRRNCEAMGEKAAAGVEPTPFTTAIVTESDPREWPKKLLALGPGRAPFDLVFCDPPYDKGLVRRALAALETAAEGLFVPGATILVVETSTREEAPELPPTWELLRERGRGTTSIRFYLRQA